MYNAKMPTRTRSYAMETMERMLAIWIEECNQNDTNVTLNDIKKKAVLPTYLNRYFPQKLDLLSKG